MCDAFKMTCFVCLCECVQCKCDCLGVFVYLCVSEKEIFWLCGCVEWLACVIFVLIFSL